MSMFHANINYYIIIILSPYSVNTVFSIHVYLCIQCLSVSIKESVSSAWVIRYQDTCCFTLRQMQASAVAYVHVFASAAVWLIFVITNWEMCADQGTCFLDSVRFKNICNNVVTLHVTILFVSCYIYIYIWLIWQSYKYINSWGYI